MLLSHTLKLLSIQSKCQHFLNDFSRKIQLKDLQLEKYILLQRQFSIPHKITDMMKLNKIYLKRRRKGQLVKNNFIQQIVNLLIMIQMIHYEKQTFKNRKYQNPSQDKKRKQKKLQLSLGLFTQQKILTTPHE